MGSRSRNKIIYQIFTVECSASFEVCSIKASNRIAYIVQIVSGKKLAGLSYMDAFEMLQSRKY